MSLLREWNLQGKKINMLIRKKDKDIKRKTKEEQLWLYLNQNRPHIWEELWEYFVISLKHDQLHLQSNENFKHHSKECRPTLKRLWSNWVLHVLFNRKWFNYCLHFRKHLAISFIKFNINYKPPQYFLELFIQEKQISFPTIGLYVVSMISICSI